MKVAMCYIVCDECGGYYKLEPEESLEDFSKCQCGGNLRYAQSYGEIIKNRGVSTRRRVYSTGKSRKANIRKAHINFLDRISFTGVLVGLVFLIIASIIAAFGLVGSIVSDNGFDVLRSLGGYLVLLIFAIIASGLIASHVSGARDYVDGLLNGGMVGVVVSVLNAFFISILGMSVDVAMGILTGLITLLVYLLVYGSLTALGGLIAVWAHRYVEDY